MAAHPPSSEEIESLAKQVEGFLGERLPVTLWMHLLSFTEDYLGARGMLTLSRWRTAAEELGVAPKALQAAFQDATE